QGAYLLGLSVHRELVTVGLQLELAVNDRSDPARRGGHSTKSIKMRLNDTATASGSAAADETGKHLIRSGRQSSKLGHGCHVLHHGAQRGAHAARHGVLDEFWQGRRARDANMRRKRDAF